MKVTLMIKNCIFYFLVFFGVVDLCQAAFGENQSKNVVLILADDLGWADTTLYGKPHSMRHPISSGSLHVV